MTLKSGSATMIQASRNQSNQDSTVFTVRLQTKTSYNKIWGWHFWFLLTARNSILSLEGILGKSWRTKYKNRDKENLIKQFSGSKIFWNNFDFLKFWFKKMNLKRIKKRRENNFEKVLLFQDYKRLCTLCTWFRFTYQETCHLIFLI